MFKNILFFSVFFSIPAMHSHHSLSSFVSSQSKNLLSDHRRARPSWPPTPDSFHLLRASASVQGVLCGDGVGDHRRSEPREVLVLETQRTRPTGKYNTSCRWEVVQA